MSFDKKVAKSLWLRRPGQRMWFWFSPAVGLILEPVRASNIEGFGKRMKRARARLEEGAAQFRGVIVFGPRSEVVFCGSGLSADFLPTLAGWVAEEIDRAPALIALARSGVMPVALNLKDIDAVEALTLPDDIPGADPTLWSMAARPDTTHTAALLQDVLPGERLWFWLWPEAVGRQPMLVVQRAALDPGTEWVQHVADRIGGYSQPGAVSGFIRPLHDGRLQLLSADLAPEHLSLLADWVQRRVRRFPGLARLKSCALVRLTEDGRRVAAIMEDPTLWGDVPDIVTPCSVADTATQLAAITGDVVGRFWLAVREKAHLIALPMRDEASAAAFQARVGAMLPEHGRRAVLGTIRRLASGTFVLSTDSRRTTEAAEALARLVEDTPALGALTGARLIQIRDGRVTRAAALPQEVAHG